MVGQRETTAFNAMINSRGSTSAYAKNINILSDTAALEVGDLMVGFKSHPAASIWMPLSLTLDRLVLYMSGVDCLKMRADLL